MSYCVIKNKKPDKQLRLAGCMNEPSYMKYEGRLLLVADEKCNYAAFSSVFLAALIASKRFFQSAMPRDAPF